MFLHGASAMIYHEPIVVTLHSPLSTYFYGIHGLVQHWWQLWEQNHLPAMFNRDFALSFMKILGGVAVDGGGFEVDSAGHIHKINPWGPLLSQANLSSKKFTQIEKDMKTLQQK